MFAIVGAGLGAALGAGTAVGALGGAAIGGVAGSALGSYSQGQKAASSAKQAAQTSANAQTQAAQVSAEAQREALNYLKEREAIPQQFREEALKNLGGLYGLEGGVGSQQELIDRARTSPLYQEIMGARDAGEDAILRNASATGGLRSGNVQSALYDYDTRLQNQALLQAYNQQLQGLTGLAQLPSNVNQIAQTQAGIGQTQAAGILGYGNAISQGQVASAQAQQQGWQNAINTAGVGLGSLYKYGVI